MAFTAQLDCQKSFNRPPEMNDFNHLILSKDGFIFDSQSGDTYQTNEVANFIVKLLQSKTSVEEISTSVSKTYSVSQTEALNDILEFQNHLSIIGLIK